MDSAESSLPSDDACGISVLHVLQIVRLLKHFPSLPSIKLRNVLYVLSCKTEVGVEPPLTPSLSLRKEDLYIIHP